MVKKKIQMKKKKEKEKIKKPNRNFKLEFAKQTLETKKKVYETYLEVLIKYDLSSTAYSSIRADEMYRTNLLRLMKKARNSNKNMMKLLFGIPDGKKLSEIEVIWKSEEYYDKLINLIENRISMFSGKTKMNIAKDSIEKFHAYLEFSQIERKLQIKKSIPKVSKR